MTLWSRLAGFGGLPLVSLLTPLLVLPVLSRTAGVDGWASLLVGESVGTLAAILVNWGWNNSGPPRVAIAADPGAQARLYRESLATRLVLSALVTPLLVIVCLLLAADGWGAATVLMGLSGMVPGLSFAWYAVGVGDPRPIAFLEAFPRVGAALVAAALVLLTGQVVIYPVLAVSVSLAGIVIFGRGLRRRQGGTVPWGSVRALLRRDRAIAGTDIVIGGFGTVPIPAVSASVPVGPAAHYASADKLYRYAQYVPIVLANALQSWTVEGPLSGRARRLRLSLIAHAGAGVVGGTGFALLGPFASELLFDDAVAATPAACAVLGVAFLFLCLRTFLVRLVLLPAGGARSVLVATGVGTLAGLAVLAVGIALWGAMGAALALAVSELLTWALLMMPARSRLGILLAPAGPGPAGQTSTKENA